MREIKFRGKLNGNHLGHYELDWFFGDLVRELSTGKVFVLDIAHTKGGEAKFNQLGMEVIPETVGQYTGLKDKNGKEIYEGDIVEIKQYSILEVEVYCRKQKPYEVGERLVITSLFPIMDIRGIDDYQAYVLNNIPFSYNGHMNRPRADSYQFWNFHRYVEVIGNIHDNPELLESEEEK